MCLFAFFIGPSVDKTSSDWIESTIAYYVFVTLSSGGGGSSWDLCRDLLGYLAKKEIALAASEQSFPDRVAEKRQEAKMHSAFLDRVAAESMARSKNAFCYYLQ